MSEEKAILSWDESDNCDAWVKDAPDNDEDYKGKTEEELREIYWQSDYPRYDWENFVEMLDEKLKEFAIKKTAPGGKYHYELENEFWRVDGINLGWRHSAGMKIFRAEKAEDWLRKILPQTDCTFSIYDYTSGDGRKGLSITNSHHDAMGEVYIILPATDEETNDYDIY